MHSPLRPGPPPLGSLRHLRYRSFYPLDQASVRHAREEFRAAVYRSQLDGDIAEAAELCLSELAGNAIRHAKDPRLRRWFHVECNVLGMRRRYVELGVHDIDGVHIPVLPDPATAADQLLDMDEDAESGRGLLLVAMRSDGIGVDHGPGLNGKRMWCRWYLPIPKKPVADPRAAWASAAR
jgi:anti-sigma regulatory factor (Ser/Thr protein kinase)